MSIQPEPKVDSTLSKGLLILETLAASPKERGVTELSLEIGLTKSNTYRLLRTLCVLGYVKTNPQRTYQATMKAWQVGLQVVSNLDICQIASPHMKRLSDLTHEAIYLAIPHDLTVIYIDKLDSKRPIRSFTPKGGSAPMHCVGTGKALLAASYGRLREDIQNKLERYTDKTITSITRLDKDVANTLSRGYAIDVGEYRDNIYSFGAAVYLPNGEPICAIGVSAPNVNLTKQRMEEICAAVKKAARDITDSLKHEN